MLTPMAMREVGAGGRKGKVGDLVRGTMPLHSRERKLGCGSSQRWLHIS